MEPNDVKSVMVVGAGVMGHSIAQVFAQAGIDVFLVDLKEEVLEYALDRIRSNLGTLTRFGLTFSEDKETILSRIHPTLKISDGAEKVDFALEAVVEVPEVKRDVFLELENACPKDLVMASNTSSLDIFEIAQLTRPERLLVAHWFAPAFIIPLVEVVPGPDTDSETIRFTVELMERIGKRTLTMKKFVKSFIVNRIQIAIARVVWEILENDWATPEDIDLAIKLTLGIRLPIIGVVQHADFTGLDLAYNIQKARGEVVPLVEEKVKQGHFGAKTGKGLYDYGDRTETEILETRNILFLKMLKYLEEIDAFKPI